MQLQPGVAETKYISVFNEATAPDGRIGADAYIRVALVPIWSKTDGSNSALPVSNVVLTLAPNATDDWIQGKDGYYYYKYPVAPGSNTSRLLESVSWNLTNTSLDAEYLSSLLEVQVLADAIQSQSNAIENYWGVDVQIGGSTKILILKPTNTP